MKNKGEIISEYHKNGTSFYLLNHSSSKIISFTVSMSGKTSIEKKYLGNKKSVLVSDSTSETAVLTLAPGARQFLATAQDSDTLNLDAQDKPFTYSTNTNPTERYSPLRKGIIITTNKRTFEVVGAIAK